MAGTGDAILRRDQDPLVSVEDLTVEFPTGRGEIVHAVSGISFDILEGETLGIVGESGCGKSTTGRAIMQLPRPTSGSVKLDGVELTELGGEELRRQRPQLQMIFQDPISSLNPRRKVRDIVARGPHIWEQSGDIDERVRRSSTQSDSTQTRSAIDVRASSPEDRRSESVSPALILNPKVIICDEPVSALDVSVQAQILNLLEDMKQRYSLTLAFIAHDLAVVKNISDRVLVMYLGKICEVGPPDVLYRHAAHHYTAVLLDSIPRPIPQRSQPAPDRAQAELPSPINPPSGCRFRTRCPAAQERCTIEEPKLRAVGEGHFVACHFPRGAVHRPVPRPLTKPSFISPHPPPKPIGT